MLDAVGPGDLAVIANTGDDCELYGVHVSPDPDLVTYWLADAIDARGYGIRGDSWEVMDALETAGRPAWFRLGDRDLAMCLIRTERLRAGERLTLAHAAVVEAMGVGARVLPMSDDSVRTHVRAAGAWRPLQEFLILEQARGPVEGVEVRGAAEARPTPEVLAAIAGAEAIVIGPSNPAISIGPILAMPGVREALSEAAAPVVAVSPFVGGRSVKGPTELFFAHAGLEPGVAGMVRAYGGIVEGVVADEPVEGLPALEIDTVLDSPDARLRVARETLEFARGLAG
jgi:LPPG:FO 2-phospho-L-lactate transferase